MVLNNSNKKSSPRKKYRVYLSERTNQHYQRNEVIILEDVDLKRENGRDFLELTVYCS